MYQTRHGNFDDSSIDDEKRSVKVVWSTGAKVLRKNWLSEPVFEELDMSRESVDLTLLNSKAPLLLDHNSSSVKSIVGVVENGSANVDGKNGYAVVRFGSDSESDNVFRKIKDGLISKVSIGYSIEKTVRVRSQKKDEFDTIKAVKWTPREISLVVFPADPYAGIRNENNLEKETENIRDQFSMVENQDQLHHKAISFSREKVVEEERRRITEIQKMVRVSDLNETLSDELISKGLSLDDSRKHIFEELEKRSIAQIPSIRPIEITESKSRTEDLTSALLHRFDSNRYELNDSSRALRNVSLCDAARIVCRMDNNFSKSEIVERALSTTDFPHLLANIFSKTLRREYEEAPKTFEPLVRKVSVPDFKKVSRVQMGDAPVLLEKSEHGQYQSGFFSDASESYSLKEWGRKITITRQMLINDDLSAMLRLPAMFARRASELESDLAWSTFIKNYAMGDGINLFHEKHGNYIKSGSTISAQSIGLAKTAMRSQKGLNGSPLNLVPN